MYYIELIKNYFNCTGLVDILNGQERLTWTLIMRNSKTYLQQCVCTDSLGIVLDAKVLKDKLEVPLKLSPQQRAFVLSLVLLVRLLSVYICRTSEHCDILINRPGRAHLMM